jgi:acetate kinase
MKILVLNAGSSSQKSCLYDISPDVLPDDPPEPIWEGTIDWTHQVGVAEIKVKTATHETAEAVPFVDRPPVVEQMLGTMWQGETQVLAQPSEIEAVGHRVVHGGRKYHDSIRITPEVKAAIAQLAELAPVHNPANLEGIAAVETILGEQVLQVAVFDTAFHAQMPDAAAIYPGTYEWVEKGIYRYGFHGTSHQYCAERAADLLGQDLQDLRLITCHLGNGASLAAIRNGRSIDTTMGFTPLDGLMMGTRSGAVDPSILIHLMRHEGYDADKLDHLLNKNAGLLGISGVSNDMRQIMKAIDEGNDRAKLAIDLYIHRLRSCIGSMLASLGGLDALIFTAGVGENSPPIRAAACEAFAFLGIKLDLEKNAGRPRDQLISTPDSSVKVLVIHTQEDWAIARDCWKLSRHNENEDKVRSCS